MAQYRTVPKPKKKSGKKETKCLLQDENLQVSQCKKYKPVTPPPSQLGDGFSRAPLGQKKTPNFFLTCFHEFCFIGLN